MLRIKPSLFKPYLLMSTKNMYSDSNNYDIVVVGAGVFGLSTGVFLATHYPHIKFAIVEQFKIGHGEGSSGSEIRIIRSTYENRFYRDLCMEGINHYWPEIEGLFKERFIAPNSCLYFTEDAANFKDLETVAKTSNGQIQMLPIQTVKKQFPTAPNIQTKFPVFHDTKAGVVFAEKYMKAMEAFLKGYHNATIYEETSIGSIQHSTNAVKLTATKQGRLFQISCKKVSLNCGRWIGKLVPQMNKIVKEVRQTVSYWQMKQPEDYMIGKFPCWIHTNTSNVHYYGLPDVFGMGLKYALHSEDESLLKRFSSEGEYERYMIQSYHQASERYFPGRYEKLAKIEKCYYTVTKTGDFLIDWSDQQKSILIVSPCSGHGFKFASVIGKIVSDLLMKDQSIQVFEKGRFHCRIKYHLGNSSRL